MAHTHSAGNISRILIICSLVNLLYVAIEAAVGLAWSSAGLVSDAGHNLSDVITLLLSLIAIRMTESHPDSRTPSRITFTNALLLLVAVGLIVYEAVDKIFNPEVLEGGVISLTAGIGIIVNGVTAILLSRDSGRDINIRTSFLHMLSDTLVSVGVVVSGVLIKYTGLSIIDPIVSLVIAVVILVPALRLLKESLKAME